MSNNSDSILTRLRKFNEAMDGVEILKSTEAYGYNYAELKDILKVIEPKLKKVGLWYHHYTSYELSIQCNTLTTVVYSTDNEDDSIVSRTIIDKEAKLGGMTRFMVEGAGMTYFRRYHLAVVLNLITDEDHDAGGKRTKAAPKKGAPGRSVESASNTVPTVDFVQIFTNLAEKKTETQFNKTFDAYKSQMNNEDIKKVENIRKEKYGN